MADPQQTYAQLCDHARKTELLTSVTNVLGWDEQTYMPPAAGEYRADQLAMLASTIHQQATDPQVGDWLAELESSPLATDTESDTSVVIREMRRSYDRKTKLPADLVEALTRATSIGQQVWVEARKANDYAQFAPKLETIFKLKREEADAVGYTECRYDALLDDYEPHTTASQVEPVLRSLGKALVPLVAAIGESKHQPDMSIMDRDFPVDVQAKYGSDVAKRIGFCFQGGRIDPTAHPFCTTLGPADVRLTTRYNPRDLRAGLFSIMHEAGHGLYEQGLPSEKYGLPTGEAISLGIHESQSRMWEILVGLSHSFWQHNYADAQAAFPAALGDVALDDFHFAINESKPSLIRVEADEATYNLHILIRFELELALVADELSIADLPAAWNAKYEQYLGITPPSDALGVMQDVHWSHGLIGYFPTYSLGNLYSAQFFAKAKEDLGDLDAQFAQGDYKPLLDWLRTNIHQHGKRYTAADLVERVTGKPLSSEALLSHLSDKFGKLYRL
ncbi:carboxypeptidase M32 [Aeoliella mucimassa]|uniref:Metal-dependent carboxypeptidase n=1 Tax=Aeoliella mucimassa TaxID=2527972 RepID=A0A518AVR9_9BACT|nr:carboxypeptidase M32 [Aeoliella mucimassa]QDU58791.1 Thermostable carboxypeptidase 1 [Aeoliella mucimassa]